MPTEQPRSEPHRPPPVRLSGMPLQISGRRLEGDLPTAKSLGLDRGTNVDRTAVSAAESRSGRWQRIRRWGGGVVAAAGLAGTITASLLTGGGGQAEKPAVDDTHQPDTTRPPTAPYPPGYDAFVEGQNAEGAPAPTSPTSALPNPLATETRTIDEIIASGEPLTAPAKDLPEQAGYHDMQEPGPPPQP